MSQNLIAILALLPITLLPLFVAALCGIAAAQQRSRPLRTLAFASVANALSMPVLSAGLPDPERLLAATLFLFSTSLYWLAVTDMMGRPRHPARALLVPLGWVGFVVVARLAARLAAPGLIGDPLLFELLSCLAADDLMLLLCIPLLATVARRSLSHNCMIAMVTLGPVISGCYAATRVWPGLASAPWVGLAMLTMELARSVLSPGLAILTVMDMATCRERSLALHDELSGLLNRRGFFRRVAGMSERTLLLFDIDHFKRINDTFGHAAGDAAIRRFAQVLNEMVGRQAVLGRVGGEEFTAAISGASRDQVLLLADRIRLAFADAEQAFGSRITVSIGVAMAPLMARSVGEQMAVADRALYRAKQLGRNRVELDEDPVQVGLHALR